MAEFNLADVLRDVSAQDLGQEGREKLVYLDIDLIDDDPKNFYDLSNVEELANNIEMIGQQQPARVRVHPDNTERYMIVSGHRRRAARRILVQEGKEQFRLMPCIIEQPAGSEALQELRLIYANSDTRRMTAAEISRQAERVEMLLYELKEQGMEFSGRMRDHVAEACKVSKSKLSRLKVIREKLSPVIKPFFDEGKLAESTAYALAQQPKSHQIVIWSSDYNKEGDGRYLREYNVRSGVDILKHLIPLKCEDGSECPNFERMVKRSMKNSCYSPCGGCCKDCCRKLECSTVCAVVKPVVKAAKAEEKAKKEAEQKAHELREAEQMRETVEHWQRLGKIARDRGVSFEAVTDIIAEYGWQHRQVMELLESPTPSKANGFYGDPFNEWKDMCELADLFGVSADYLLGRTDTPQPTAQESAPVWRSIETDPLPDEGDEVITLSRMTPGAKIMARIAVYRGCVFKEREYGMVISGVLAWQPYHYEDNMVPESDTTEEREDNDD